jgi:hypothetical protein
MSSDQGEFDANSAHLPNYESLKTEHLRAETTTPRETRSEPPAEKLPDTSKSSDRLDELRPLGREDNEAFELRAEIMAHRRAEGTQYEKDNLSYAQKLRDMCPEELQNVRDKQIDEAKRAALAKMESRTPPPAPEEPHRPETYGKSR